MSVAPYQVIFAGLLRDGVDRREGIRRLAKRFNLNFPQIKRLLSGEKAVVKVCEELQQGEQLLDAFWRAGWHAELMQSGQPLRYRQDEVKASVVGSSRGYVELFADDRSCSLRVPGHWLEFDDLNKGSMVQAGNLEDNQFLVVLCQSLKELQVVPSIGEYCAAQLKQCADKVNEGFVATPSTPLEQGRFPGYFGEITAQIDSVPVQYLVACLRCGDRIFTLFLWCEAKDYSARKADFNEIVASFSADAGPALNSSARIGAGGTTAVAVAELA